MSEVDQTNLVETIDGSKASRTIIQRSMNFAVQTLVANQIEHDRRRQVLKDADEIDMKSMLEQATTFQCEEARRLSARYLEENHRNEFDQVALIGGWHTTKIKRWESHVYMIAKDSQGKVFGCSPANYELADESYNPLITILESKDIESMIQQITELEGGNWEIRNLIPLWNHDGLSLGPLRRATEGMQIKSGHDPMNDKFDRQKQQETLERLIKFFKEK